MKQLRRAEQDEIQIHVVGRCGSGKTTIQVLIADVLREYGFNVYVETRPDYRDETDLRRNQDLYREQRYESIKKNIRQITINEVQAQMDISRKYPKKWSSVW
jgi:ABC-type oligopeptide transport system ATPase subunit